MKKLNKELLRQKIETHMADDIANAKIGGATLIVNQNGERVYEGIFYDEKIGEVKENTIYRLASMTKPVVAAAVMIARDRGLLDLDDTAAKYIPGFAEMNIGKLDGNENPVFAGKAKGQITIRHLLTHSGGLGSDMIGVKEWDRIPPEPRHSLEKMVGCYTDTLLAFEPGTKQSYSPVMAFDTLGRIIEIVSGMSLGDFLEKEIFSPLGMNDTTFEPNAEQWTRFIPMHNRVDDKAVIADVPANEVFCGVPVTCHCGGGGLASTAEDYSKFAEMLLWGKGIIKPETLHEMATPQLPPEVMNGEQVWGLGMRVIVQDSYKNLTKGSFGWSGAFGTHFWVDPVNKITALHMKNSFYDGGSGTRTGYNFEGDVTESLED